MILIEGDLLRQAAPSPAAEAIELFCYIARKHIGALATVLDGLDALVFTGGIGEHAPSIRGRRGSRATTAACDIGPPSSVTTAAA